MAALLLLSLAGPLAGQRPSGCREIPWNRPRIGSQVVELENAGGTFRFRVVQTGRTCRTGGDDLMVGIADESGRILIHPSHRPEYRPYWRVTPLGSRLALVDVVSGRFVYDLAASVERPGVVRVEPDSATRGDPAGAAAAGAPPRGTVRLAPGAGPGAEFRDAWVEVYGSRIAVHARSEEGQELSQLFDLDGAPRTPVVGRVAVWGQRGEPTVRYLMSELYPLRSPTYDIPMLYLPLREDGTPMPLPAGAVGVFPVADIFTRGHQGLQQAAGWGVVFAGSGEPEVVATGGSLAAALGASGPRYTGFLQRTLCSEDQITHCAHFFLRQAEHQWVMRGPGLSRLAVSVAGIPAYGFVADPEVTVQQAREWNALPLDERRQRRAALQWSRIQGNAALLCDPRNHVDLMPREGLERYFRECEVESYALQSLGRSVSAEALAIATRRHDRTLARRAEEERRWAEERWQAQLRQAEVAAAWSNGLRAMQQAAGASVDRALRGQYDTYRRNLDAYNSGAHNWCCGGIRPPDRP